MDTGEITELRMWFFRSIPILVHSVRVLNNVQSSPNTIQIFRSRTMKRTVYAGRIGVMTDANRALVGKQKESNNQEDRDVDGGILQ
jgi:hypothetical protein